jgi:uncharacterized protein (TIGR02996 family)
MAFLAEAKERFEDDVPRLVLADWLEEYGDADDAARAEFVRAQCERARLGYPEPRAEELLLRERDLLGRHRRAWYGPLVDRVEWWNVVRGLAQVRISAARFASGVMNAVAGSEIGGWVDSLWLSHLYRKDVRRIAACSFLAVLVRLQVDPYHVGDEVLTLTSSPHLARLRHLTLQGSYGEGVVVALASAPLPPGLTRLRLDSCGIRDRGALALAASPHLDQLTSLCVWNSYVGPEGAAALRQRFGARLILPK